MTIETNSQDETKKLGRAIGERLEAGDVVCLTGDLGVGKTVFVQGVAEGLGIEEGICSPTFTLIQEYYEGRLPLYHFDVYRIAGCTDMDELGYEEYFYGKGVCLVEWGELVRELFPENSIYITIEKDLEKGFDYRKITISKDFDIKKD
ncbi:MAG: tRNA (adenosine(37)-N6)-threonylcarbamoyltransferase complex ATPase subunit type 1 TsaE [Butyrivibrio sp.]